MNLSLQPDVERYIAEQVEAGNYPTPEAVIEAAVCGLRDSAIPELDEETIAAINEGEAEIDRGECVTIDEVRANFRKYFPGT